MGSEAEATVERAGAPGLIGRGRELRRIAQACRQVARGPGSLTVVTGRAGSGKSRLLDAAADQARAERMPVVAARCWPDGGAPPLWPWQPIVRDLCGPEAAALLDEAAGPEERRRFRSCAAITERLVEATAEQPTCLVIDDVHAADAGSLSLLRFVVRAEPRPRLAIVVSTRTRDDLPDDRAHRLLDEIGVDAAPLVLRPFDLAEAVRFLQAQGMVGADGHDEALLQAVVQVCCGNPAELRRLALGGTDLVGGLRRVVRGSVAELSDLHRTVLQAGAVLGASPPIAEVAAVAGCDRADVLSAIAAAAGIGLVTVNRPRVEFGHESVRAALECTLRSADRLDVHARAASVASRCQTPGPHRGRTALSSGEALRWAYHALAAAPRSPDDARTAVDACRAAGSALRTELAMGDADDFLTAAVEQHDQDPQSLGSPGADLLVEWAQAALQRGHLARARERFERAVVVAEQADDVASLAEAALGLSGQWLNDHRAPLERSRILGLQREVRARLADGTGADGSSAALRVRLDVRLAAEAVYDGHPDDDVFAALDAARSLGDDRALAEALSLTHHVLLGPQHARRRLGLAGEMIEVAAGCGDAALGVQGLCWRAVDLFLLGDDRAARALEVLRERATALGNRSMLYLVEVLDVMLLVRSGRLDDAEDAAQQAHHRGQLVGEVDAFNYLSMHLLVLRWLQDRHGELADVAETMIGAASVANGEFAFRASAAVTAARAGRLDRARGELDVLLAHGFDNLPRASSWLTGMTSIIQLAVDLGDAGAARQAYDLLAPYAELPVLPSLAVVCLGSAERWLGLAAGVWGDHELARHHFERAVRANLVLGNRPMVAMTRAELAASLMRCAWPAQADRAAELLDQAIHAAEEMGMSCRAEAWRHLEPPEPSADPAPQATTSRRGHVRRRGRGWLIALDDRQVTLPDLVGVGYLAELLRNPGRRISAVALIGGPGEQAVHQPGDHHEVLDDQARLAYGERLRELTAELDEAEGHADLGRADRLRVQIDALVEHLEEATGLGGRSRSFAHSPERARVAARKAIARAIDRIDAADPVVGTALRSVIVTGTTCSYEPSADPSTTWTAGTSGA